MRSIEGVEKSAWKGEVDRNRQKLPTDWNDEKQKVSLGEIYLINSFIFRIENSSIEHLKVKWL